MTQRTSPPAVSPWYTHPLFLIFWAVACVGLGIQLLTSALQARSVLSTREKAKQELQTAEREGFQLIEQVEHSSSSYAQEKIIRDELNLQKPGEIILQLPTPAASSQ